ncbi:MAG: chemotaxis protein CheW [Planctomycetota bacterium]
MADFPLNDGADLEEDPELLAAMAAAFGEEAVGEQDAESHQAVDENSLQQLVDRLDGAIDNLEQTKVSQPGVVASADNETDEARYVVFEMSGQLAAFPLSGITEIERLPNITPLPRTPEWCLGIANVRGQIVSVTDLAALTGATQSGDLADQKVIMVHSQKHNATTALVVDRVIGIRSFGEEISKRPEELNAPLAPFATEIARVDQQHILLVQADELLSHPEMQPFMKD